jgi:hypothetical protein
MPSGRQVPSIFVKPESLRSNHSPSHVPHLGKLAEPIEPANIVTQAASVLARELSAAPASVFPSFAEQLTSFGGAPSAPLPRVTGPGGLQGLDRAPSGLEAFDMERLRRQVHEVVETFISGFSPKARAIDQVPLVHSEAAVDAGGEAVVYLRVANEDGELSEVSLYCSNFVADSGREIPALRARFSPHVAKIPPKGEVTFELKVSVPLQASAEVFSALVQATGARYVKAVVSIEVR